MNRYSLFIPVLNHVPYRLRYRLANLLPTLRAANKKARCLVPGTEYSSILAKGALFIRIPKTGSSSIVRYLYGGEYVGHVALWRYQTLFTKGEFNNLAVFCVVRNPITRFVSAYNHTMRNSTLGRKENSPPPDPSLSGFVKSWVNQDSVYDYLHFRPQSYYLSYRSDFVDHIGKFEDIEKTSRWIAKKFSCELDELPHWNASVTQAANWKDLDREAFQLLIKAYQKDIDLLGYRSEVLEMCESI